MPRQHRHRYAAVLPHGLLGGISPTDFGVAAQRSSGVRCIPAHIHQVRAGTKLTRLCRWFLSYTLSSCLPDPGRLVVPARPVVVGAAPTLPGASQVGLPPASPACCDRPMAESFHLHPVVWRLVARGDLLLQLDHADVALGQIIGRWDPQVLKEPADLVAVGVQPI